MSHPSEYQLQQFIDKILDEEQGRSISLHLLSCVPCAQRVRRLERMETLVKRSLTERAPAGISENVLNRLGIHEAPSFAWTILKNLAPVFGLVIIGVVVFLVFKVTGRLEDPAIQSSLQAGQSVYAKIGQSLTSGIGAFNHWMKTYIPFAFAGNSGLLTAFITLFLLAIALLDRFIFAPMMRKGKRA
jgi:hypothetical protein